MESTRDEPRGADPARLLAIRRHLASCLPADLLDRFWHEGFAVARQPSFRLNAMRLSDDASAAAAAVTASSSSTATQSASPCNGGAATQAAAGRCDVGSDGGAGGDAEDTVRQLLAGFGLPADTPVERCPYHPLARLLPARTAAVVRVADQAHALGPLRRGSAYFMGLSSMLPALALMAHTKQHQHQDQHQKHQHQQPQQHPYQSQRQRQHQRQPHPQCGSGGGGREGNEGRVEEPLRVLDLCAAPGGKTALMAELMGNTGTLLAVDASWPRLQRLQFNVDRLVPNHRNDPNRFAGGDGGAGAALTSDGRWWRRGCVVAAHADGTSLRVDEHGLPLVHPSSRKGGRGGGATSSGRARRAGGGREHDHDDDDEGEIGLYDRVLVDAPCSGLGRLQLHRPSSYSRWDESHVARHPERQRQLLLRGARLLRRGGSLVYSTCTIDPRENEAMVAWLLGRMGGSLRLVEPRLTAPAAGPAPLLMPPVGIEPGTFSSTTTLAHAAADAASTGSGSGSGPHPSSATSFSPTHPHGALLRASAVSHVSLREALEGHRPSCTYPPLLDGPWWDEAIAGGGSRWAGGRGGSGGGRRHLPALRTFGGLPGDDSGGGGGGGGGGLIAEAAAAAGLSRDALRDQLAGCCLRVAPGPTYEGFFLAQVVRD
ncbi:hypothetical protein PLESTB_001136700 [Pleodorina starrii]|uniref:SAM-dependent MTase RsmB/NOP-type domain-containing protein n=1 Tax=Pleodorina starrii TaxID=330485 RepID=A0A9W6BRF3_9CHLO|nr:hypothetical protein PLESTM_000568100 [Pleodorina starrii]GLC56703.1 hypothetical protein PLESTB_001136700 [Pleodorina starrii]GLC66860.1 hypothetical protein PLESTF_000484100 [Pleodorina starrii]